MSDVIDVDAVEIDGRTLRDEGRRAREERRRGRSLRARLARTMEDRPRWLRVAVFAGASVATLVIVAVLIDVAASFGRVHPGVRIGEVRVGAASPASAIERVDGVFGPRLDDPVTVAFEGSEWLTGASALGASLESETLVAEAMSFGRTGPLGERVATRARLWFTPAVIPVSAAMEESAVAGFLDEIAEDVEKEPRSAAVVIEGTDARLEPAELGVALRRDALVEGLAAGLVAEERTIEARVEFTPVRIADDGAAQALADARAMLDGPVTVVHDEAEWEFSAAEIATWISFREVPVGSGKTTTGASVPGSASVDATAAQEATGSPAPAVETYELEAYIDYEKARDLLMSRTGSAGRDPVDARFQVGGGNVTIIPSQDGVGPDIEALVVELTRVLTTSDTRVAELRTRRVEPEITTEKAQAMGINERIATYTTSFSASNRPRVNNIHTLAAALDGTLVPPGGVFSFNETIGPRTAAKGYQEAPAIIGGQLVPTLGGGICQVATTMFNTVFESGLTVVERRNHSFYISSYPNGRDAAVAWGGVDLKFKNDTSQWILVATAYSNSSVTVSLYGTDPGYTVTASAGPFTDIVPFSVKETEDPTLALGTRIVEDSGVNGRRIAVKRTVKKGGSVVREDTFTSVYRPKQEVVRVGTKVDESVVTTGTVSP